MKKKEFNTLTLSVFSMIMVHCSNPQKGESPKLEVIAEFGADQPIGVSVSSDNRVFVSFPNREPYLYGLTEIKDGKRTAYPNPDWNNPGDEKHHFVNVQDLYIDTHDQLWVLDSKPSSAQSIFGNSGDEKPEDGKFKLLQIDLKTDSVIRVYHFEDLDKSKSGLNDVRIDTDKQLAYFSDPSTASIVVMDLKSGKTRTLLANSTFTSADPSVVLTYEGHDMRDKNGKPFASNINGIALTKDNKYFYFKPINETHLYRIETVYLADTTLDDNELSTLVENLGETTVTHGLIADKDGNIYLTSSLDYSIKRLAPDGTITTVVTDPRIIWPDSMGIGSDGYLYFSCAQVNRLPQWNDGVDKTTFPYTVFRVKI